MAHLPKGQGIIPMPPFMSWLSNNIPAVYDNTMSYYEELCSLIKYLEDVVVPAVNANAEALTVVSNALEQLKQYVDTYFANLDVQEEINNKLDQMAEDGTLQEIITAYIQANVAWTFASVAEMKTAENLISGSYAKTLGYYARGDEGGATYYITDTEQEGVYHETLDSGLYANIVTDGVVNVKQFGAKGDGTTNDTTAISNAIDHAKEGNLIVFPTATYVCNIYCTKALHFDMQGSKLIANNNSAVIKITGSKSSSSYVLSADLVRDDRVISFLNTGDLNLEAGDYILIRDDSVRPSDGLQNINEEVHQIESITSNTITIKDYIRYKKSIATSTANIYKLNMVSNVSIKNVDIEDNELDSTGIDISYCTNVTISNIKSRNMESPIIALYSSVGIEVSDFNFEASRDTSAGNGYAILLNYGTNSFHIFDGCGDKQRHLVDCSSAFDGKVDNVIATNSQGASFVMAHNSFGSDITFNNCHADGDWVGFVYVAQGVTNYYDMTAYNFNILNCTVHLENASDNSVGCYFQCPAENCTIDNFTVKGKVLNSYGIGIKLKAINNRVLINNYKVDTVRVAYSSEDNAVAEADNFYYVKIINTFAKDVTFFARIANVKQLYIDKIYTDNCRTIIFTGAYDADKTNALKFFNLTNAIFKGLVNLFVFNNANYEASTYIVGKINNINLNTAQGNYKINVVAGGKVLGDITGLFSRCSSPEGIIAPIWNNQNADVTLASDFIANGLTLYQTVTIINYGESTITLPHSTTIQNIGGTSYALTAGSSIKYIWNGVCWHQVA